MPINYYNRNVSNPKADTSVLPDATIQSVICVYVSHSTSKACYTAANAYAVIRSSLPGPAD